MKPRIVFIHGNQTRSWQFAWTPWLQAELQKAGYETDFQLFPDSIIPPKTPAVRPGFPF